MRNQAWHVTIRISTRPVDIGLARSVDTENATGSRAPESLDSASSSARGFNITISRPRLGHQRIQQSPSGRGHLPHRAIERCLVGPCRFCKAGEFPHELERGVADLLVGRRRVEVEQRLDVSAHGILSRISGRERRWEAVLNHVGLPTIPRRQISVVRLLSSGSMPTKSSETDSAIGGPMRTNRSMPSSTVIPVLVYPDAAEAVDWLCSTFGFTERLRIGSHRSQLTVGDGSIVVAAGPPRPEVDSKKTQEGRGAHPGETHHPGVGRVPKVDRHFARAKNRGAKILQPPTHYPLRGP